MIIREDILLMILAIALLTLFVISSIGCSDKKTLFLEVYTPDFIEKESSIAYENYMESTPIVWNGELLDVVFARQTHDVLIYKNGSIIAQSPTVLSLGSALVDNGTLYLFGLYLDQYHISMVSTTDMVTWTSPVTIFSPGYELFNNSVTKGSDGRYYMAYETCESDTTCFNARFAVSNDLLSWTAVGSIASPNEYFACPTIRQIGEYYYIFYLRNVGHFATYVIRTKDFQLFDYSNQVVLSALGTDEGNNNSDMDFTEFNNQIHINYAIGDQVTYTHIKKAVYQGTLESFVNKFF